MVEGFIRNIAAFSSSITWWSVQLPRERGSHQSRNWRAQRGHGECKVQRWWRKHRVPNQIQIVHPIPPHGILALVNLSWDHYLPGWINSFSSPLYSEFQGTVDTAYTCKWFAPLSEVHIEEPDYHAADVWDKALLGQGCRNEGKAGRQHVSATLWEWGHFVCSMSDQD